MSFDLKLYAPEGEGPFPVLLTGDECFGNCTQEVIREANGRGYLVAIFNRLNFALDNYEEADYTGGVYDIYPGMRFGAIAVWAWGYHRCVDALEQRINEYLKPAATGVIVPCCEKPVPARYAYCPYCGQPIGEGSAPCDVTIDPDVTVWLCGQCGSDNPFENKYCGTCGKKR